MYSSQPEGSPIVLPVLLQTIADAICDRAAEPAPRRVARRREIAELAQAYQPNDAVEMMLVSMVIAHAHLLEDATRDVFGAQDDRVKVQTKSQIVALDRGMLGYLKELPTWQDRRRKAEAAADKTAGAVAMADGGAAEVDTQASVHTSATDPVSRDATASEPATPLVPQSPEPLLPPLRHSEVSAAAMMAVLAPSTIAVVPSRAFGRRGGLPATESAASPSGALKVGDAHARAA